VGHGHRPRVGRLRALRLPPRGEDQHRARTLPGGVGSWRHRGGPPGEVSIAPGVRDLEDLGVLLQCRLTTPGLEDRITPPAVATAAAEARTSRRADHAARYRALRPADVHAHLDGAPGPDDRSSSVVASWTATALRSRRRTGPRGGRCPGWLLPPTVSRHPAGPTARVRRLAGTGPRVRGAGRRRPVARLQRHGDESTPDATSPRTSGTRTAVGLVTGSDPATRGAPPTRARAGRSSAGGSRSGSSRARRRGCDRR
jgi:hypothetical protein